MAKINVILEARGKDRGAKKLLRDMTKLADGLTASVTAASAASRRMVGISGPIGGSAQMMGAGRGRGGTRPRRERVGGAGRGRAGGGDKTAKLQKDFDKALTGALRGAKAEARALNRQARAQERAAKRTENLSDEQLKAVEITRETNRRRQQAARAAAKQQLGPGPGAGDGGGGQRGGGGRGDVAFGANLALASREFEQFGAKVEGAVSGSFDAFKDFEKGVVEVATLTKDIDIGDIERITKGAVEQFGGLPIDQVKAFYSIVSAGATDATSAQQQLNAANNLAVGGVAQQEEAVLAISKSLFNFGESMKAARVEAAKKAGVPFDPESFNASAAAADILFATVQKGQVTVSQLSTALPLLAQQAGSSGLSMEEAAAAISSLSKAFPTAKQGATALRQALAEIGKGEPTKAARKEAAKLGIDFSTAGLQAAGGLQEFLLQIAAADKFSEKTLSRLFGSVDAKNAVEALIKGMDDFQGGIQATQNATGASAEAANKIMETSAFKVQKLEGQMELLKIQAGEALVPALTAVAAELGPIIKDVTAWIEENPKLATTIGKVAIGVAVGARAIGGFVSALSMIKTISGLATAGMGTFNSVLGAVEKRVPRLEGKLGKLGGTSGTGLVGPFVVATTAIAAFEVALLKAEEATDRELSRLDELNKLSIAFQTEEGEEKTEKQLLQERRQRLVEDVEAKRTSEREVSRGTAGRQFEAGNIFGALQTAGAGLVETVSGVERIQSEQTRAAELALAGFDIERGEQLGLAPEQLFQAGGAEGGLEAITSLFGELLETNRQVAANTSTQPWQGSSMDGGLVGG